MGRLLHLLFLFAVISPWLNAREVTVGIYQNAPKYFLAEDGKASGFFGELFDHIADKEGWKTTYVPCSWKRCLEMTEEGKIDLMLDVAYNEERVQRFDFNREIILSSWVVLYAGRSVRVDSVMDLDKRRIALLKGSVQERLLNEMAEKFGITPRLVYVISFDEAFKKTDSGETDLAAVNELYGREHQSGYSLHKSSLAFTPDSLHAVTKKGTNGALLQAVDGVMKELKADRHSYYYELKERWFGYGAGHTGQLHLTGVEKAWLKAHPLLRVGIHSGHAPVEYLDDKGKAQGIAVRLFDRMAEKLGVSLHYVAADSFAGLAQKMRSGEVDLVASAGRAKNFVGLEQLRLDNAIPIAIFKGADAPRISDPTELSGKQVAVLYECGFREMLQKRYPKITFISVKSLSEAVAALRSGRVDAFAGNQIVVNHFLHQNGHTDIKIAVSTTLKCEPRIGIRPDWPELTRILNKALLSIPDTTRAAIRHEMIGIQYSKRVDYSLVWKIGGGLSLILAGMFFWNRRLKSEIRERHAAEAKLQATLDTLRETQSQLIQQSRLDSLSDLITNIAHHWRQPLNMLALYIGDLKEAQAFNELDTAYLEAFNEKSQKTIAEMSRMIDGFREFYLIHETRQKFSVKAAMEKALAMTDANFETLGIAVSFTPEEDAFTEGYPNEFTQVLITILQNAKESFEETTGDKRVDIRLYRPDSEHIRIEIGDNGRGIEGENAARIFEPYYTTKFKAMGVGVSLYTAKMVVEKRMAGRIYAYNRNRGAVFEIELPVVEEFGAQG